MVEVAIKYRSTDSPQRFRITDRMWWLLLQRLGENVPPPNASMDEVKRWHLQRAREAHPNEREAMRAIGVSKNYGWRMDRR